MAQKITQQLLQQLFEYREDGVLLERTRRRGGIKGPGEVVGTPRKDGYVKVSIEKQSYLLHRLIFLYHRGYLPTYIDHADYDHTNNRIENLRECTWQENNQNRSAQSNSTTGEKGLYYRGDIGKWYGHVMVNGILHRTTVYADKDEAREALRELRTTLHGKFARD